MKALISSILLSLALVSCGGSGSRSGGTNPVVITPPPISAYTFPDGFWLRTFSNGAANVWRISGNTATTFYTPDYEAAAEWSSSSGTFDTVTGDTTGSIAEYTASNVKFSGSYEDGMTARFTNVSDGGVSERQLPLLGLDPTDVTVAALNLPFDEATSVFPNGVWYWAEENAYLVVDGPSITQYENKQSPCWYVDFNGSYDVSSGRLLSGGGGEIVRIEFEGEIYGSLNVITIDPAGNRSDGDHWTWVSRSDFNGIVTPNTCQ